MKHFINILVLILLFGSSMISGVAAYFGNTRNHEVGVGVVGLIFSILFLFGWLLKLSDDYK